MKIHPRFRTNHRSTTAALETGTHFYTVTLPDLIDSLNENEGNIWLIYALQEYGWNALDTDHNFYGSAIVDDIFYLCVTDGHEIEINNKLEDPETVIEEFGINAIANYLSEISDDIIHRYITPYEMNFNQIDINNLAIRMLEDDYTFLDLVKYAKDADIVSDNEI